MSNRIETPARTPVLPWLPGGEAFASLGRATMLVSDTMDAVMKKQVEIWSQETTRFMEHMEKIGRLQSPADLVATEACVLRDSVESTRAELQAINDILIDGGHKLLDLCIECCQSQNGQGAEGSAATTL